MWWIIGIVFLVFLLPFLPSKSRRCSALLRQAQNALARRDRLAYDSSFATALDAAQKMQPGRPQWQMLGHVESLGAQAAYTLGNFEDSIERLARAVEYYEKADAPDRAMSLANAHRMWGEVLTDTESWESAEDHLRSSVNFDQSCGNEAGMMFGLQRLGDVLIEANRVGEAQTVITRCVDVEYKITYKQMQAKGLDPRTGTIISMSQPDLCLVNGEFARAEKLFQEKVDHWTKMVTKPDNIDVLRYQFHLSRAQTAQGRVAEAAETLRAASTRAEQEYGPLHPRTLRARKKLEEALRAAAA